ncbi:MAG: CPBP family intramembrane metalloprotease [Planctomycetota bacterium]|nr:CPBP family intramembrane metalloprotease [Planctomycetota bacterium]
MPLAEALTEAELLKILLEKPAAMWAFMLSRFGPIAVGLGLALAAFIRRGDRKSAGLPPPPLANVTVPFDLGQAALLLAAGFFILPAIVLYVHAGGDVADAPLWLRVGAMGAGAIPVAVLVMLRRQRMRLQAADHPAEVAEVFGDGDAPHPGAIGSQPTPPPSARRAMVLGLKWVCLALLIATPLALGWTFLIKVVTGETPSLQGLVQDALDPNATYEPWLIAAYGVIIAPFTEEALFRGLLYPALYAALFKITAGNRRKSMWVAAIAVSLLFAAVHGSMLAMVPLFALAMVLTWVLQKTNSLGACIVAHAAHNALSMIPVLVLRIV